MSRIFQTKSVGDVVSFPIMREQADGTIVPQDFSDGTVRLAFEDPVTGKVAVHSASVSGNTVSILTTASTFTNPGIYRWQVAASFPGGFETRSPVGTVTVRDVAINAPASITHAPTQHNTLRTRKPPQNARNASLNAL